MKNNNDGDTLTKYGQHYFLNLSNTLDECATYIHERNTISDLTDPEKSEQISLVMSLFYFVSCASKNSIKTDCANRWGFCFYKKDDYINKFTKLFTWYCDLKIKKFKESLNRLNELVIVACNIGIECAVFEERLKLTNEHPNNLLSSWFTLAQKIHNKRTLCDKMYQYISPSAGIFSSSEKIPNVYLNRLVALGVIVGYDQGRTQSVGDFWKHLKECDRYYQCLPLSVNLNEVSEDYLKNDLIDCWCDKLHKNQAVSVYLQFFAQNKFIFSREKVERLEKNIYNVQKIIQLKSTFDRCFTWLWYRLFLHNERDAYLNKLAIEKSDYVNLPYVSSNIYEHMSSAIYDIEICVLLKDQIQKKCALYNEALFPLCPATFSYNKIFILNDQMRYLQKTLKKSPLLKPAAAKSFKNLSFKSIFERIYDAIVEGQIIPLSESALKHCTLVRKAILMFENQSEFNNEGYIAWLDLYDAMVKVLVLIDECFNKQFLGLYETRSQELVEILLPIKEAIEKDTVGKLDIKALNNKIKMII